MDHEKFMRAAIEEAVKSQSEGGQPFGSVIVKDGQIVARAHNSVEQTGNPLGHAEVNALQLAHEMGINNLSGYTVYASFEPCAMCSAAIAWMGASTVVFGADPQDIPSTYPPRAHPFSCEEILERSGSSATVIPHVLRAESAEVFK